MTATTDGKPRHQAAHLTKLNASAPNGTGWVKHADAGVYTLPCGGTVEMRACWDARGKGWALCRFEDGRATNGWHFPSLSQLCAALVAAGTTTDAAS